MSTYQTALVRAGLSTTDNPRENSGHGLMLHPLKVILSFPPAPNRRQPRPGPVWSLQTDFPVHCSVNRWFPGIPNQANPVENAF